MSLLKAAILAYGLPEPTFVLAPIAFALSYGYFTCLEMNADRELIVVVPNCGYCFFSVDVFKLQRNKITFLYSSITDGVGGRSLTYLMALMVQEQCAELSLEEMESLPFLRLLDQLDKQKKVLCTGGAGAWRE